MHKIVAIRRYMIIPPSDLTARPVCACMATKNPTSNASGVGVAPQREREGRRHIAYRPLHHNNGDMARTFTSYPKRRRGRYQSEASRCVISRRLWFSWGATLTFGGCTMVGLCHAFAIPPPYSSQRDHILEAPSPPA